MFWRIRCSSTVPQQRCLKGRLLGMHLWRGSKRRQRRQRARAPGIGYPDAQWTATTKAAYRSLWPQRVMVTWISCLKIAQETQVTAA